MKIENIKILAQYINALEEAGEKIEKAYNNKDIESLNKLKKFILEVKLKIDIMMKNEP